MFFKRKCLDIVQAFQYFSMESVPEELKYSSSNTKGLMSVNLPGKTCNQCGGYSSSHASYYKDGYQYLVCPGQYILYKDGSILECLDYNKFKELYSPIDVIEVKYEDAKIEEESNKSS